MNSSNAQSFSWPLRVYFHDTDAGGVVFHGSYLNFMEAARTEYFQSLDFSVAELAASGEALFVVYALNVNYHKPARLHDSLRITASVDEIGRAHLSFDQRVLRGDETLVTAKIDLACVNPRTLKPVALPARLRSENISSNFGARS
jgi:acyl-CoA thioester hydrolase